MDGTFKITLSEVRDVVTAVEKVANGESSNPESPFVFSEDGSRFGVMLAGLNGRIMVYLKESDLGPRGVEQLHNQKKGAGDVASG